MFVAISGGLFIANMSSSLRICPFTSQDSGGYGRPVLAMAWDGRRGLGARLLLLPDWFYVRRGGAGRTHAGRN